MPKLNSRGDVAHGVGGSPLGLNNDSVGFGPTLGWKDDDTIAFCNGNDNWIVSTLHVPTRHIERIDFFGQPVALPPPTRRALSRSFSRSPYQVATSANHGYSGGGHIHCWYGSPGADRGVYSTTKFRRLDAGLLQGGYDGAMVFKPNYQSNGPTNVREVDGAIWKLTDGSPAYVHHVGAGRCISLEVPGVVIPHNLPALNVDTTGGIWKTEIAFAGGQWWISYYSGAHGIVLHPFGSFNGYAVLPKGDGWHTIREISPTVIRVAVATGEGEHPGQIWMRDYDVEQHAVRDPWGDGLWKPIEPVDIRQINIVTPPEETKVFQNYGAYVAQRWNELGVPEKTAEVTRANRVTASERKTLAQIATMRKAAESIKRSTHRLQLPRRIEDLEDKYKAVQCPAFVRIVGELHHSQNHRDVGLSVKRSGSNWNGYATDIIALKPTDTAGVVVAGNFALVDCIVSVGSADAKPTWNNIGENTDANRPWAEPPAPDGDDDNGEPPTGDTHRYIGGGNDTGICDECGRPKLDAVHRVPEGKIKGHTPWQGEDGKGDCDLCFQPVNADIHKKDDPIVEKHEFVGSATAKFCEQCGKPRTDPIHQIDEPQQPGTFDDTRIVAALNDLIAEQKRTTAAIDKLRVDVIAAAKDLGKLIPNIFGRRKK